MISLKEFLFDWRKLVITIALFSLVFGSYYAFLLYCPIEIGMACLPIIFRVITMLFLVIPSFLPTSLSSNVAMAQIGFYIFIEVYAVSCIIIWIYDKLKKR
jgi:hypothetical protein